MKKVHSLLSRVVDVKPAETLSALFMGLLLFSLMTAIYIVKAVKVSKFLDDNEPQNVAFAYLLTAFPIGFFVYLNSRLVQRLNRFVYIGLSLLFFSASLLLFWFFYDKGGRAYSFVFWFWCEIFIAASITQFWILVNDLYNPRQAKRLVGFFVSGGLLGGITGALLTSILAARLETRGLLLICPFFLVGCAGFVYLVRRFRPQGEPDSNPEHQAEQKEKIPYLKSFS
ncbi:MAG: MFS transporter, partial [Candidatus Aminicenantes bacterium]|nr:MFS transporter [Candidatus Aminicenantes bacterium]